MDGAPQVTDRIRAVLAEMPGDDGDADAALRLFASLFSAESMGVTISDERVLIEANDAFLEMIGRTRPELEAGLDWTAITPPEYVEADARALASIGSGSEAAPYEKEYIRPDGRRVAVLINGKLISREPLRIIATSFELTERRAAERDVAAALARTRRLQQITASLSATNSAAEIARAVLHHGLEELSASAAILVRGDKVEHAVGFPPAQVEGWTQFPATLPAPLRTGVMTSGKGLVGVPLVVADRRIGVLGLTFREGFSPEADTDFLVALANQAAAALDRVELFENRAYVARTLQDGLLPQQLADIDGLEVAVVYESISGTGEVGGDFYDVFRTGPERWALTIGDVSGKGTEAAVVTGLARHTIRAVARVREAPAEVLGFLNEALRAHDGPPAFCTVGYGVVSRADAGFRVRMSSGGHPFPFVLRAGGELEEIEVSGTMLGVAEDPQLEERVIDLAPGDALVVYTDGVTDARVTGGERFGDPRLHAALSGAAGADAAGIAGAVESAVRDWVGGGFSADDRAVVVLRVAG
ncbi:MAG: hypothetical protein QOF76_130 [Solirubrobacteraceae bacterium]|jgi:PAS domain S-box-containing protein|nr:hypothetical protein [Solirubrobacteraceae bacterium]